MNSKLLLFVIVAVTACSCSTAYKSGQTPDDVYYSPVRTVEEDNNSKKSDEVSRDGQERKMKMKSRDARWRDLDDDFDCHYDPYRYGYSYGYYYNPYYYPYPVYSNNCIKYSNPKNSTPRMTNLNSYYNTRVSYVNPKTGSVRWVNQGSSYNNSNSSGSRSRGSLFGGIFDGMGSTSGSSSGGGSRGYSPSSGGGSGISVPRPSRN